MRLNVSVCVRVWSGREWNMCIHGIDEREKIISSCEYPRGTMNLFSSSLKSITKRGTIGETTAKLDFVHYPRSFLHHHPLALCIAPDIHAHHTLILFRFVHTHEGCEVIIFDPLNCPIRDVLSLFLLYFSHFHVPIPSPCHPDPVYLPSPNCYATPGHQAALRHAAPCLAIQSLYKRWINSYLLTMLRTDTRCRESFLWQSLSSPHPSQHFMKIKIKIIIRIRRKIQYKSSRRVYMRFFRIFFSFFHYFYILITLGYYYNSVRLL